MHDEQHAAEVRSAPSWTAAALIGAALVVTGGLGVAGGYWMGTHAPRIESQAAQNDVAAVPRAPGGAPSETPADATVSAQPDAADAAQVTWPVAPEEAAQTAFAPVPAPEPVDELPPLDVKLTPTEMPPVEAAAATTVNRCIIDGKVDYRNSPCPSGTETQSEGSASAAVDPDAADVALEGLLRKHGVTGDDRSALGRRTRCEQVQSEIDRLNEEFGGDSSPEAVRGLATRLNNLRAEMESLRCGAAPEGLLRRGGDS